ncbi:RNA 2',3'-cyclic phosphodiesterase [archaeon]|nr:RNA 2',3'-cyclic phosphodiesterase [archaeon]
MRYFISIELNDELQTHIKHIQENLSKLTGDTSLTTPNQEHVTLKYLGELNETTLNSVRMILRELICAHKPFKINTTQINAFPSKKNASVIWLGIQPLKKLIKLHNKMCELTNIPNLNKTKTYEFRPHITIARVKPICNKRELQIFFKRVVNLKKITINVNEIKLKQSTLTSCGPVHKDIETFTLRA